MALMQESRNVAVATSLGEDVLVLRHMSATERLSRLFTYELEMLSEDGGLNLDDLLGQNVTVRVERTDVDESRYFNGFVSRCSNAGNHGQYARYRATLKPWLWFLTRTADCRIFQEMTAPDIIKQIFQDHGFSNFKESLFETYRTWEYCVQYRETDFNFVSRLMEQEGIYYYFEHDNGTHTLVLADGYSSHSPISGHEDVPYFPPDGNLRRESEHIYDWQLSREVRSGAFALKDFDFVAPKKELLSRSSTSRQHAQADFELYDYPGEYAESGAGDTYARIRMEEQQARY
ncbi:MAG: type VI secretion system tip protein TssI/VgrG, partial [Pseudomonadota bacterium]